jgi:hypothetical protein
MILLEREWLASGEPDGMLAFLERKASKRKIHLFYCAAVHRLSTMLTAEERRTLTDRYQKAETMSGPASRLSLLLPLMPPFWGGRVELLKPFNGEGERWARAKLLRDIFSPLPFRPIALNPAWLTWHDGLLVSMAQRMYDSRKFSDMPILADALEEAGCTNQDILGHCRSGGEHVRGCWVVDALLGKE